MRLGITEYIDAAHHLPGHEKCGRLHGHTYQVDVTIANPSPRLRNWVVLNVFWRAATSGPCVHASSFRWARTFFALPIPKIIPTANAKSARTRAVRRTMPHPDPTRIAGSNEPR